MQFLVAQCVKLAGIKAFDSLEIGRILRDQRSLLKQWENLGHVSFLSKIRHLRKQDIFGNTSERVLYSRRKSVCTLEITFWGCRVAHFASVFLFRFTEMTDICLVDRRPWSMALEDMLGGLFR